MLEFGSHLLVGFLSMKMLLCTISDLELSVRRRDLLPRVNGDAERLQFSRYGLSDLVSPDRF
jgi:hypothetical protein